MVCGTSQACNDWFDRHVDAINEPARPIPSGRIPGRWGLSIACVWTALSLLVAAALGPWVLAAGVVGLVLAWAYSAPPLRLKLNGWWGNSAVGLCYEGLPWFTGAAALLGRLPDARIIWLAFLYSAGAFGIMVLNDFKSIEGDQKLGVRTLPVQLGVRPAAILACVVMAVPQFIVLALLLSMRRTVEPITVANSHRGAACADAALGPRAAQARTAVQRHRDDVLRRRHAGECIRGSRTLEPGSLRAPPPPKQTTQMQKELLPMDGQEQAFDVVVVGGGPSGATAANELAKAGRSVLLLDKAGRIKPCGGAIPPRLIRDFAIPEHLICAQIQRRRMVAPSHREVDMPIDGGYVGMVNREEFDEFLRERAAASGAVRRHRASTSASAATQTARRGCTSGPPKGTWPVRTRLVIGADGALSQVARQEVDPKGPAYVFAYHEIVRVPKPGGSPSFDGRRCDVIYDGAISPGLLRLGLPAWRDGQRRLRQRPEGLQPCAARSPRCARPPASAAWRRCAAKARPSR